ncbi:MAG: SUMF1/EgtB/PvdO family nonheme iron enzyme [Myxococcales bacterium]|nr:SUMF1/EgtB/PvdO family nonheme iron enzyme [Myxococcales bacterium]
MRRTGKFGRLLSVGLFAFCVGGAWEAQAATPCKEASAGMVCIPGGSFTRGDNGEKDAKPAAQVTVETFYLDKAEVTNEDYDRCVKAGRCFRPFRVPIKPSFLIKKNPVTHVTWYDAVRYCRFVGKRLPTEAEWERAARGPKGTKYAWGDEAPSCKRAHSSRCGPRHPIGTRRRQAQGFGLYHMAGNVAEWVQDWYTPCYGGCSGACGDACQGDSPKGPCGGKDKCPASAKKILRGGSFFRGAKELPAYARMPMDPMRASVMAGIRCASSTEAPSKDERTFFHLKPRPQVATPTAALEGKQKELFNGSAEDVLANKKLCPRAGRSGSNCRDPNHYVTSNERHQYLWYPYIQNLGGGYVGIGADQNYNFIAWARSEYVWLMDYDAVIPWVHKVHRAFLLKAETGKDFVQYYAPKRGKSSLALLKETYKNDPDLKMLLRVYRRYQGKFFRYFNDKFARSTIRAYKGHWLITPEHYAHIRKLHLLGRFRALPGDLLKEKSLRGVAEAAKAMGIVVRMAYFSNAEEYWPYGPHYRESFRIMPMDKLSLIIRTLSHPRWGSKSKSYFHYNIQHGLSYKRLLAEKANGGYKGFRHMNIRHFMERYRIGTRDLNLTLIQLPRE